MPNLFKQFFQIANDMQYGFDYLVLFHKSVRRNGVRTEHK